MIRVLSSSILCVMICVHACWSSDSSYEDVDQLMHDLVLSNPGYNKRLRPLNNQSEAITIQIAANLLAVLEIDAVSQAITFNAFFNLIWTDEKLKWNSSQYGDINTLPFDVGDIWTPQFVMYLSDTRNAFNDDDSTILVRDNMGTVAYGPGGVYRTFCKIQMTKFPFDSQECTFVLCPVGYTNQHMKVEVLQDSMISAFTLLNEEWEILKADLEADIFQFPEGLISCIVAEMMFKRRPRFMIMNIVLPVVLLSFINVLSFIIPVESGEKVSFAITLLLAISVYMTVVSGLVPRSSNNLPALTIYLFIMLFISVLAVVVTVLIVFLHNKIEKEQPDHVTEKDANECSAGKVFFPRNNKVVHGDDNLARSNFPYPHENKMALDTTEYISSSVNNDHSSYSEHGEKEPNKNDDKSWVHSKALRLMVEYGNVFAFVFFTGLWTCSTIWYFSNAG